MGEHEANIYMYDILEPAKKIDQCVPWSVASNQSGAWCLGRQSRRCSRYFDLHVACKVCLVFFFAKCSCCAFCLCAGYDFFAICSICDFLLWSNMAHHVHHAKNDHMLPTVQRPCRMEAQLKRVSLSSLVVAPILCTALF